MKELRYSEQYVEDNPHQLDSGIRGWMKCVAVNIIWNIFHSRWTHLLQVEISSLLWTLMENTSLQVDKSTAG